MISASPMRADQLMVRRGWPRTCPTPISAAVAMTAMIDRLERKIGAVEDAERRAAVQRVGDVEEARG